MYLTHFPGCNAQNAYPANFVHTYFIQSFGNQINNFEQFWPVAVETTKGYVKYGLIGCQKALLLAVILWISAISRATKLSGRTVANRLEDPAVFKGRGQLCPLNYKGQDPRA